MTTTRILQHKYLLQYNMGTIDMIIGSSYLSTKLNVI